MCLRVRFTIGCGRNSMQRASRGHKCVHLAHPRQRRSSMVAILSSTEIAPNRQKPFLTQLPHPSHRSARTMMCTPGTRAYFIARSLASLGMPSPMCPGSSSSVNSSPNSQETTTKRMIAMDARRTGDTGDREDHVLHESHKTDIAGPDNAYIEKNTFGRHRSQRRIKHAESNR